MQRSHGQVFRVHPVSASLRVRLDGEMPTLPPDMDEAVEALWRDAAARVVAGGGPALFNGVVFSADVITPTLITGHLTEFRRVVAQMEQPSLFLGLRLRPLAVCGVLRCTEGIVVGRRPGSAIYQPGMWQLPPAGSVDVGALQVDRELDVTGHLLTELDEELGLPSTDVSTPKPICLVEHHDSHVLDLGMAITTELDARQVMATHASSGNGEYDNLRVIPISEIPRFVAMMAKSLVPSAIVYLTSLGYI